MSGVTIRIDGPVISREFAGEMARKINEEVERGGGYRYSVVDVVPTNIPIADKGKEKAVPLRERIKSKLINVFLNAARGLG